MHNICLQAVAILRKMVRKDWAGAVGIADLMISFCQGAGRQDLVAHVLDMM